MDGKTKFSNWIVLLIGLFLGILLTTGAFGIFPVITNKSKTLKWADWTGFGEDTTTEASIEKNNKGQIVKQTDTIKTQSGKTLWDVLNLAGTLAIPVLLAILGIWFQRREQKRSEEQAKVEKDIANENLRDDALQTYIDRMSELLLDQELIQSEDDSPVRDVARTRTLTILRRLKGDEERKVRVLHFLYDAGLLEIKESAPFIDLRDADFGEVNLGFASLKGAYLMKVNLKGAYLMGAYLKTANLMEANLMEANLMGANLERTKNCNPDQIKAAINWEKADYDPELRHMLGLPPKPSEVDKG
ncbi:pentapeptide repeat protein (plasmid) [Fischerella sp. NIES-4106]|nr:pentapeptide repeat protein [Fischerella sp. NIES-4106]